MKSITLLIIPLFFLLSCTESNDYYSNLKKECAPLASYEQGFCEKSVERMQQGGYKKAEKIDNKFICPEGLIAEGEKSIGSLWYCIPNSK